MRPHRSILIAVPTAVMALLLLSGCVDGGGELPGATPTSGPTTSATPTPTPTPTATVDPSAPDGIPLSIGCDTLISPQAMLDYNPNFTLMDGYVPAAGTLGAEALRQNGVACAWVNGSNGQLIELSVAQLPDEHLNALMNQAFTSSNSVPTYGVEGYFLASGGVGTAQAFPLPYWVVATSPAFFEPGDVEPIIAAVKTALGQ